MLGHSALRSGKLRLGAARWAREGKAGLDRHEGVGLSLWCVSLQARHVVLCRVLQCRVRQSRRSESVFCFVWRDAFMHVRLSRASVGAFSGACHC